MVRPVRFSPGRAKLAASPSATGSTASANTMGMVAVALLPAFAAAVPSIAAGEAISIGNARSVTDQPAKFGKLAQKIDCRERMALRQPDQLIAPAHIE